MSSATVAQKFESVEGIILNVLLMPRSKVATEMSNKIIIFITKNL